MAFIAPTRRRCRTPTVTNALTYLEVLARDLKVMDAAAISLARENNIPILVFSITQAGAFSEAICGKGKFTIITE